MELGIWQGFLRAFEKDSMEVVGPVLHGGSLDSSRHFGFRVQGVYGL